MAAKLLVFVDMLLAFVEISLSLEVICVCNVCPVATRLLALVEILEVFVEIFPAFVEISPSLEVI